MDTQQSSSKVCFTENKLDYENKKSDTKHAFDTNEVNYNNNKKKMRVKTSKLVAVDMK
jgi:hypothetical protein